MAFIIAFNGSIYLFWWNVIGRRLPKIIVVSEPEVSVDLGLTPKIGLLPCTLRVYDR